MRRILLSFLLGLALVSTAGLSAQASPVPTGGSLESLGLPELEVTVTDTGIEGLPGQLEANRYLVNVKSEAEGPEGIEFVQPPQDVTMDEFIDALADLHAGHAHGAPGADDHGDAHATPEHADHADAHATPEHAGDHMSSMPAPVYGAIFAGGIVPESGQTAQAVVDLTPGNWLVTGGPDSEREPMELVVTGEMPAELAEPEASATLTMGEYVILVSEGELVAGPQVVRIENIGAQPHFVVFNRTGVDVTTDEVIAAISGDNTGTPAPANAFDPAHDLENVLTSGTQSFGTTSWVSIDLEPGRYVLLCHFPDIEDGHGHDVHGMVNVLEIPE